MWETWVRSLGWEVPLKKEMATHSSIHAWKIPWAEEPGRLQSMGLLRVGHGWATSLHFTSLHFTQPLDPAFHLPSRIEFLYPWKQPSTTDRLTCIDTLAPLFLGWDNSKIFTLAPRIAEVKLSFNHWVYPLVALHSFFASYPTPLLFSSYFPKKPLALKTLPQESVSGQLNQDG